MMKIAFRVIFIFSSLPINSSLQNNPRYQFSLKSENIEILTILLAAILKITAIQMQFSSLPIYSSLQNNPRYPFSLKSENYYYSSSSSRCDFIRPISQRLIIWSLLNFTGRWIPISRGAFRSWNFQNGHHCHKFHHYQLIPHFKNFHSNQRTLKFWRFCRRLFARDFFLSEYSWTCVKIFYRKPPKGFPQDLAYILNMVFRKFWPKKIVSEWIKMTLNAIFIITNQFLTSK
jgi:hypothetical protein